MCKHIDLHLHVWSSSKSHILTWNCRILFQIIELFVIFTEAISMIKIPYLPRFP